LEIKRQTQSQHQLPFAFVQYADIKSVVKAMKAYESKLVRDHSIKVYIYQSFSSLLKLSFFYSSWDSVKVNLPVHFGWMNYL
jgi:hypothetical protein